MFEKIKRRLSGVLSYDRLMEISNNHISMIMNDDEDLKNFDLRILKKNDFHFAEWKKYHSTGIETIADSNTKYEQIIKLRNATVNAIETSYQSLKFIEKDRPEQGIIAKALNKGELDQAVSSEAELYVYSTASCRCFRTISFFLGDAKNNDWFDFYNYIYGQFITHLYDLMIDESKGDVGLSKILVKISKEIIDDVKPKIYEGYNWDFDKEKIEQERRLEEAIEKANEPQKQRVVSVHQIDELSEYLLERYNRLCNGELYKIEEYSPKNPIRVLSVDTALMLIGLSECLEDYDTAKTALKKIMHKFIKKIDPKTNSYKDKSENDINIEEQIEILEMKDDNKDKGWLSKLAIFATCFLYDVNFENLTKEEKEALGASSVNNINDAWEVYANTKNAFGWKIEPKLNIGENK